MKIIILIISLYTLSVSMSYSEIKSCKMYKKNSNEYKNCVNENVKIRNESFFKDKKPLKFLGLKKVKSEDNIDNNDQKPNKTITDIIKKSKLFNKINKKDKDQNTVKKTLENLFKKKDVDNIVKNNEAQEKKSNNKSLVGVFKNLSDKKSKKKTNNMHLNKKNNTTLSDKSDKKPKKTLAKLFGWGE